MTKYTMLLVFALWVAAAALPSAEANVHPNEGFGIPVYGKKHINETQHFYHEGREAPSIIKYDVVHDDDVVHLQKSSTMEDKAEGNKRKSNAGLSSAALGLGFPGVEGDSDASQDRGGKRQKATALV